MGSPFVFLLNRAAAAAAAAAVTFLMAAIFWRRPGSASHHKEQHPWPDEIHDIFLSHSGQDKRFVEHLYDALKTVSHTAAFFDKKTLPKGCHFPSYIKRAAHGCKLGVVVLSDDFLTSKWPMLELQMLVSQRDRGVIVLPLFYKLHPKDFKDSKNLSKWKHAWKKLSGDDVDKWDEAVRALRSINGEIFTPEISEVDYIKKVVYLICKNVPSPILHDLSPIKGHERIAKVVASQFAAASWQPNKVCMVGLHGVSGLGKTTVCKIMFNFYILEYPGKSCHIEFPRDGDNKKIVQECKKALKQLTNLSEEHILNKADSLDQVVRLMQQNLSQYKVFLAIDNVWESSVEAIKRILEVSFGSNSKILLTSQSKEVLQDLVRGHINTTVQRLPSPGPEEAFEIFQGAFELGDLLSVKRNQLDSILKRCFFSGTYHALALKALGKHVKKVCSVEGLDNIEDILSDIDLRDSNKLIRLNYVDLVEEKKNMFLDIVVVMMGIDNAEVTYEKACLWLSILYKWRSKSEIASFIYELALDGLMQLENIDGRAEKMIRVHDLYFDLAQREAANSARFFTDRSTKSVKEIEWERLERVILRGSDRTSDFIEELQQQECPKLAVLCAQYKALGSGIHLHRMPSVCVLKLVAGDLEA